MPGGSSVLIVDDDPDIRALVRVLLETESDITIDLKTNKVQYHDSKAEPWVLTLVDTGLETLTGGRLKRVRHYLRPDEPFCMTYGDGLGDIDIAALIAFHKAHGKQATLCAVVPPGRYGALEMNRDTVRRFVEKPPGDNAYVNGGEASSWRKS